MSLFHENNMMNRLRPLRLRAGLSRQELAVKVRTNPLQILRAESGKLPTEIGLAKALCAVLGKPIHLVFPGSRKALAALAEAHAGYSEIPTAVHDQLRIAGLEADTRQHTIKVMLRGHVEPMFFDVWPHEVDRLFSAVQSEPCDPGGLSFLVFQTKELSVAISLRAAVFCHFLWDVNLGCPSPEQCDEEGEPPLQTVRVFFGQNPVPISISPEPESDGEIEDERNYLNRIFLDLDSGFLQPHHRLHIVDEDGESAFIRAGDLALLTVPLWALDQNECLDDEDGCVSSHEQTADS